MFIGGRAGLSVTNAVCGTMRNVFTALKLITSRTTVISKTSRSQGQGEGESPIYSGPVQNWAGRRRCVKVKMMVDLKCDGRIIGSYTMAALKNESRPSKQGGRGIGSEDRGSIFFSK